MSREPQTTHFVILSHASLIFAFPVICLFLPFRSFCHLASVNRFLTEALRQLSLNGLARVGKRAHFIPPNLTPKSSLTTSTVKSPREAIKKLFIPRNKTIRCSFMQEITTFFFLFEECAASRNFECNFMCPYRAISLAYQ